MTSTKTRPDGAAWKAPLNGDPIPWLLEESNPCVRWRTLRELLDRPDSAPDVIVTAKSIRQWEPIAQLLEMAADPSGFAWPSRIRLNTAFPGRDLGQIVRLGVPLELPELRKAFDVAQVVAVDSRNTDCYLPQLVMGLLRLGGSITPQMLKLVEKVITNELLADGNRPPTILHGRARLCCGSHGCHNGVVRAIDCVASVPTHLRTPRVNAFLAAGAEYLAAHRLYLRNHHRFHPILAEYTRLHQPWGLDWKTDILDMLDVATRIGMSGSPALSDALRLLLSKQDSRGRWPLEVGPDSSRPLVASLLRDIEKPGAPGKWVTLQALVVLRRCAGWSNA